MNSIQWEISFVLSMGPTKDQKQSFIFGILNCQVEQWQQLDRTSLKVLFAQMPTKDLSFIELGFWDRVNEVRLGNWGGDGLPMKMEKTKQKLPPEHPKQATGTNTVI